MTKQNSPVHPTLRRTALGFAVLALVGLIAAACAPGGAGYGSTTSTQAPAVATATASPAPTQAPVATSPSTSAAQSAAGSSGTQDVQATLTEFTITLSASTLKAGHVRFTATNTGKFPHALEVTGQGIDQKTQNVSPGQSATLDVDLTAGKYEVWCPVDSHKERGMDTSITVQ